MESFYFQTQKEGTRWEENVPTVQMFENRTQAVNAAKLLSNHLQTVVRLSNDCFYKANSGSYIRPEIDLITKD